MCILNYEFHEFNNEYNEQRFEDLKDFEPTSDKDYTNLLRAVLRNYYYGNYGQNYDYYGNSFPNKCPELLEQIILILSNCFPIQMTAILFVMNKDLKI